MTPRRIVVMGVCGCGKSALGERLAHVLGWPFVEGDTLHPPRNVERMAQGIALTDADRAGWLDAIAALLAGTDPIVVSCSALKRSYRDRLRAAAPDLHFIHLHGARAVLEQRLAARTGHYMPAALLQSQLDILEPPGADEAATPLDLAQPLEALVAQALLGTDPRTAMSLPGRPKGESRSAQHEGTSVNTYTQTVLATEPDGRARFHEARIALDHGSPQAMLSALLPSGGCQLRRSPVGFRSEFHCTVTPQWVFILRGRMEIGLQDGITRVFGPGEHFHSRDTLPAGALFDPLRHGHRSRQVGPDPLETLFVRDA